jgi:chromosome segregation ATPase
MEQLAAIVVGSALTGGVATELLRRLWPSRAERADAEDRLREDLMQEIASLRGRVDCLDHDLAEWKGKYFSLLGDYAKLKAEVETLRQRINCNGGD